MHLEHIFSREIIFLAEEVVDTIRTVGPHGHIDRRDLAQGIQIMVGCCKKSLVGIQYSWQILMTHKPLPVIGFVPSRQRHQTADALSSYGCKTGHLESDVTVGIGKNKTPCTLLSAECVHGL